MKKYYLVTTDHLEEALWFRDNEDFVTGMNYVAIQAALMPEVMVLVFILMSNHVHFVLYGTRSDVEAFVNSFKGRYSKYLWGKYKTREFLRRNGLHIKEISEEEVEALERAITPSAEKLEKHAVASVRQRVRNLREIKDLGTMTEFRERIEKEMGRPSLVIFDLDGTLLNTIDDLGYACNHALEACGFPTHAIEEYPRLVGNGVNKLIERALPEGQKDEETVLRVRAHFVPYYNAHNCDFTRPYDGIPELLESLKARGCMLAVASNKYQAATEKIVSHFFPGVFDVVLGEREGVPRKPDPQIVRDIEAKLQRDKVPSTYSVLYVGDSLVDQATAANAGVPFVACSWGFVAREKLAEAGCERIIDNPMELLCKCGNV